jgi:PAS domain S-box-containing protein
VSSEKPVLVDLRELEHRALVLRLRAAQSELQDRWVVVDVGARGELTPEEVGALTEFDAALAAQGRRCAIVASSAAAARAVATGHDGLLWAASREAALAALSSAGATLGVLVRAEKTRVHVELRGDLDLTDRFVLDTQLESAVTLAERSDQVLFDLGGLRFIEVAALRSVAAAARQCRLAGARVDLAAPPTTDAASRVMSVLASELSRAPSGSESADAGRLELDDVAEADEQAVIVTNLAGRVTAWNRAAERLYGWAASEVMGRAITELTVGPEDQDVAEEIMQAIQTTGVWEGEFTVRGPDGARFVAHVRDTLVRDREGRPIGVRGRSYAVTSPQRAERRGHA